MGSDVNVPEVPFKAMYDADSAVIALQDKRATDADKTRAAVDAAAPAIRSQERERLLAWLGGEEAIRVAVKRQRLTQDAIGIAGMPKPNPENAMGAILVAVMAAARNALEADYA